MQVTDLSFSNMVQQLEYLPDRHSARLRSQMIQGKERNLVCIKDAVFPEFKKPGIANAQLQGAFSQIATLCDMPQVLLCLAEEEVVLLASFEFSF
jgi:hypothetical protein